MFINGLGTIISSYLLGKKVGKDDRGNRYFISKRNPFRKWVLYSNNIDPTNLPTEWQLWLTSEKTAIPEKVKNSYHWEKDRQPNYTGTEKAYHPENPGSQNEKTDNKSFKKENNKKIWRPS